MISRSPALPQAIAACLLIHSFPSRAAEAGAWEDFSSQDNASAWASYVYLDEAYYLVDFQDDDPTDPFISSYHVNDVPIDFSTYTDLNAGGGKLLGNYAAASVQGIVVDVLVPSLPNFLAVYPVIYVMDPGGTTRTAYEGLPYFNADLGVGGWHTLRFGFDEPWSRFDGEEWVDSVPGDQLFTDVDEISFVFIPTEGTAGNHLVGIDNVKLEPKITPPQVTTAVAGGNFSLSFTPGNSLTCMIETMQLEDFGWVVMPEHLDITGTSPYTFTTPVLHAAPGKEFFRVNYEPVYTPFVTPPVTGP